MRRSKSPTLSFVSGVVLGILACACGQGLQVQTQKVEDYRKDVAMCRANIPADMCEELLICQHAAQRAYGYPLTGKCKARPIQDAGAD